MVFTDKRYQFTKVVCKSIASIAIEVATTCGMGIIIDVVRVTNFRHMRLYMDNSVHKNKKKQAATAACYDGLEHLLMDADIFN